MTGPLARRQYGSKAHLLNRELKLSLLLRATQSGSCPWPIPLTLPPAMGARSSAQGRGRISARSFLLREESISTHPPGWFFVLAISADAESPIILRNLGISHYRIPGNLPAAARAFCASIIGTLPMLLLMGDSFSELWAILVNLFGSRRPVAPSYGDSGTCVRNRTPPTVRRGSVTPRRVRNAIGIQAKFRPNSR